MDTKELDLLGVIAFDGLTRNGLRLHPDGENIIYPMGNKLVIKNIKSGKQAFLAGHRNVVSTLCVSPCGKLLASGQVNHHGFKAMVIIWNYDERRIEASYEIHKVRVEDVCFTRDTEYLISLGGRDDGSIVVWDVRNNDALCGIAAGKETAGNAFTIVRTNLYNGGFLTVGDGTCRLWRVNSSTRKLEGVDVKVGKLRRTINCVVVDEQDENAYCGTSSGDIIKARLNIPEHAECMESAKSPIMLGCYSKIPRTTAKNNSGEGDLYAGGVKSLLLLPKGKMVVGGGDGTVELIKIAQNAPAGTETKKLLIVPQIVTYRAGTVCAATTSMVLYKNEYVLVGTVNCEIFEVELSSFRTRLLVTCHTSSIYDLAFPRTRSEIFATAGRNDVRIWKLQAQKELLRITVPNFICSSLCFDGDGRTIISAWNDGAIRGFALNGGKLIFVIHQAHAKAVSAITTTNDDKKIVSGGCDGQVRIWDAKSEARKLLCVLKEHRGPVTCLRISLDDKNLISSSTDGTCIVWDVRSFGRKYVLMGNTMYMSACFVPSGVQVLTCGTDRKIAYWETCDGSLVREVEGSTAGTLNTINVSPDGRYFITGSEDFIVRLWDYLTADTLYLGLAHAAAITGCVFAPDSKTILTVSEDGAIMLWAYPFDTSSTADTIGASEEVEKCSQEQSEPSKERLEMRKDDKASCGCKNRAAVIDKRRAKKTMRPNQKQTSKR